MKTQIYQLEYVLNGNSVVNIWASISTEGGLRKWFADDVRKINDNLLRFTWKGQSQDAEIKTVRQNELIRFRWIDEPERPFFELKLTKDEITNTVSLIVTDFAPNDEIEYEKLLWNKHVEELRRNIGV
jgi:uncharacterized protein YndB with AHSA1/START domain